MKVIDADSHVYEVEATWDHLAKDYQARRPLPITIKPGDAPYMGVDNSFWLVDGRAVQWTWGEGTVQIGWTPFWPLRQPEEAVREIERARELGAVSLVTYGTVGEKMLHASEFDPVWAGASDAGLPVCVHVGWSFPPLRRMCDEHVSSLNLSFTLPLLFGFLSFLGGGILDRFPKLRVGFLEAGAGWLPWFLERIDHYHPVSNFFRKSFGLDVLPSQRPASYRDRVYVTCEADEMLLPQVIEYLGEDNIMVSEDIPHLEAREGSVKELERRADVSEGVKRKILSESPAR